MAAYSLLSTLLIFFSVLILVHRLGVWSVASDARGRHLLAESHMPTRAEIKEAPLLARAARLGVPFLPMVTEWEETNRFAAAEVISKWDKELVKAGLRSQMMPQQVLGAALISAALAGGVMWMAAFAVGFGPLGGLLIGLPAGAAVGFYLPTLLLKNLVANRMALIEKRLPFAIEFMLLTMEANAAFPTAMEVYRDQMKDDPLAEELRTVLVDIENGLSQEQALENLGERIESDSLNAFILAVTTGVETGQPMKDVLEVQADVTRQRRYSSAEAVAKTASTRAIFPLFVVMVAALLLLLGPMLVKAINSSLF